MKNIFISSTFRDMHAERDLVQERVLPMLRAEAKEYGDNVEAIDLRWGVDTAALETEEGSARVLSVCLDEIERSHPYMLIFLGERYGWIPKGELIENAIRGRSDKYVTDDFEKSVTALEIEYGALSEKYGDIKQCVVCFREPVTEGMDGEIKKIYAEQEERGIQKLRELKEKIREKVGKDGKLISYTGTWDESAQRLVDLRADGQPLENVLTGYYIEMFRQDWKEYKQLSWQEKEQLISRAFAENKRRSFVGREELLEKYYQKVISGNGSLLLQGEAGSGKTAIMCKLAERLQKEGRKVFYFFSGTGSKSKCAHDLVHQMIYQVEKLLGIEDNWREQISKEAERLKNEGHYKRLSSDFAIESGYEVCWNRTAKFAPQLQEKIYFFIDSLEQLERDKHAKELDFLIESENIQMILSCSDEFTFSYENMEFIQKERIPLLKEEEIKAVVKGILKSYSRDTYEELEQEMMKKRKIGNPLYISFLIQRLNMMGKEELEQLKTGEEIRDYILNLIRQLPEEPDEAAVVILKTAIEKISPHNRELLEALYFLAVSRSGLRVRDLQKIFEKRKEDFSTLDYTLLMKYLDSFFYTSEFDKIDFTHKGIRRALRAEIEDLGNYERELKDYIKSLERYDKLWEQEGMYFAKIIRDYEMAAEMITFTPVINDLHGIIPQMAMEDKGEFYCEMMRRMMGKVIDIKLLNSMRYFTAGYNGRKMDMDTKLNIIETRILCWEEINKRHEMDLKLYGLAASYEDMGVNYIRLGRLEEAVLYLEKGIYYARRLYENYPQNIMGLDKLSGSYRIMGSTLSKLERPEEAVLYYEKEVCCKEALYEKRANDKGLQELCVDYNNIGNSFSDLKRFEEAASYYKKAAGCAEVLYEKQPDERHMQQLCVIYRNIGHTFKRLKNIGEAVSYYEKAIRCKEVLYGKPQNEKNLEDYIHEYTFLGENLYKLGRMEEAFVYYEKAMKCKEALYELQRNGGRLFGLTQSYQNMGSVLQKLGRLEEALSYYEKNVICGEILCENKRSKMGLRHLLSGYRNRGDVLSELGRITEALEDRKKAVEIVEEIYAESPSEYDVVRYIKCLRELSFCLRQLGREEEAEKYDELARRLEE